MNAKSGSPDGKHELESGREFGQNLEKHNLASVAGKVFLAKKKQSKLFVKTFCPTENCFVNNFLQKTWINKPCRKSELFESAVSIYSVFSKLICYPRTE